MPTFILTLFAIEILHRAFGNPRTCVTILFWRWMLGGLDAKPRPFVRRADHVTATGRATIERPAIEQAPFALAEKRPTWERRFDLLADFVAPFAA